MRLPRYSHPSERRCPRSRVGLRSNRPGQRLCYRCGASFTSQDPGHRICDRCRPAWQVALDRYDGQEWWAGWEPDWAAEDSEEEG